MQKKIRLGLYIAIFGLLFGYVFINRTFIFRADIDTTETNLISNPGFEEGSTGWILPTATNLDGSKKWQIVEDVAHSGVKSILLNNTDPTAPPTQAKQNLSLIPGASYEFSAWFKTENFIGSYIVAKIEWSNDNGVSTAGTYASETWKQVKGKEGRFVFPSNATRPILYLWAAKGSTGKVWFDDLQLTSPLFFQSLIRYPTYRNTLYPNQEKKITVGIATDKTHFYPSDDFNLAITIIDANKKVISELEQPYNYNEKWNSIDFDLANASPGNYEVLTRLINRKTNSELKRETLTFTISQANAPLPKVYTDKYNRTVVDGKLYFPLGFYNGAGYREVISVLDRLQDSKFDVLMNYNSNGFDPENGKKYLDEAQKRNLKIIYSLKDSYYGPGQYLLNDKKVGPWTGAFEILKGIVTTLKDHPALLAWYTNDELATGYIDQLQQNYDFIKSTDYNHPAWQTVCCYRDYKAHLSNTDVIGIDDYPVWQIQGKLNAFPRMQDVGYHTRVIRDATMGARSLWMTPEAKVGSQEGVRAATGEEMLNSAYQMIIGGARGLIFFNLNYVLADPNTELWQEMKQVGEQIDAIKPIALGIDAPSDKSLTSSTSKVSVLTRLVDNDIYVLAVNPYHEEITANLTLGAGLQVKNITVGLPGSPARIIEVSSGVFQDTFASLATRVYKLNLAEVSSCKTTP